MNADALELGDVELESGETLPAARLAYRTYGRLNDAKDNVVVHPTWYGGVGSDNEWMHGQGRALDTDRYFIVIPEMLGNGVSSSPSNHPTLTSWETFPRVSIRDNVRLQSKMLREVFGIEKVRLVVGFSMGAQQAYEWATSFPERVQRLLAICGTAKTSAHNWVFLEGVKAALTRGSNSSIPRADSIGRQAALKAMARVYAGWALSQAFYRQELWRSLGYESLEAYMVGFWEALYAKKDVDDLMTMLLTWQSADVSSNPAYEGDVAKALGAIKAKSIVMPGSTDLYFTAHDCAVEAAYIGGARLRVIDSVFGHAAGVGLNLADAAVVEAAIADLLQ